MNGEQNAVQTKRISTNNFEELKLVKSTFVDYSRFEQTDPFKKQEEKQLFLSGEKYVPDYTYPQLLYIENDLEMVEKKTQIYNASLELEVARRAAEVIGDTVRATDASLHRDYLDLRLRKIMLVEAASDMLRPGMSGDEEVSRRTFQELNREIYGKFDDRLFLDIFDVESSKIRDALEIPTLRAIAGELVDTFSQKRTDREARKDVEIMSDNAMDRLHSYVNSRYGSILSLVPDTQGDVYYNAEQCSEIINITLNKSGLTEDGWRCLVNPRKSSPSTNGEARIINLPQDTRRNAAELRRLIIHEQEVHARRAENGRKSRLRILTSGTATYADAEEGLGVLLECAIEGNFDNASFQRARERYLAAGLALGVDGSGPRDAREVYEILWRDIAINLAANSNEELTEQIVKKSQDRAYAHIENAFRGTNFTMKGVIYTKLKVYYEGLLRNARFFQDNIDDLPATFDFVLGGKFNHTSEEERGTIRPFIDTESQV